MSDLQKGTRSRTRYARLYGDDSMGICRAGASYEEARRELVESSDDPDVELLEIEVTVIRNLGRPKMQAVTEHSARCPCCGETVYVEVPAQETAA